jgi:hypothetical protein
MWKSWLQAIHQSIDITAAVLLATGQITIRSVVLTSGGSVRLSLSGPILGGERSVPRSGSSGAPWVLDAVDSVTALLLILGEIQTVGLFIQSKRLSLLVTGPPFGEPRLTPYVPSTQELFGAYRTEVLKKYTGGARS